MFHPSSGRANFFFDIVFPTKKAAATGKVAKKKNLEEWLETKNTLSLNSTGDEKPARFL